MFPLFLFQKGGTISQKTIPKAFGIIYMKHFSFFLKKTGYSKHVFKNNQTKHISTLSVSKTKAQGEKKILNSP